MQKQFISVNGIKVSMKVVGQGEPFLILHGWGRGMISWLDFQDKLSKYFKVIAFDLPGFGESDPPPAAWGIQNYVRFILDFAKEIGLEKFYLLGHSFGGSLAIKLAIQAPYQIKKLILVDAAGKRPSKSFIKRVLKNLAVSLKPFSFLPGYQLARQFFYKFILRKTDYLKAVGVMKQTFKRVVSQDLSPFWQKVEIPTLIVWGRDDKITPLRDAYSMHRAIRGSELEILDCGHNVHREKPDELIGLILEFSAK